MSNRADAWAAAMIAMSDMREPDDELTHRVRVPEPYSGDVPRGDGDTEREAQCPAHGRHVSKYIGYRRWSACEACVAAAEAETAVRAAQERAQLRQRAVKALKRGAGVPPRYQAASFDTFETPLPAQRAALAAVRKHCDALTVGQWRPLILVGPPGTGKTHIACALINHHIETGLRRCIVATGSDVIREIRATWKPGHGTEQGAIDEFAAADLLVVDEIGIASPTENEHRILFDVIDGRYQRLASVVLATNLTPEELPLVVGERLWDRLQENALIVPMQWPSWRGRKAQ